MIRRFIHKTLGRFLRRDTLATRANAAHTPQCIPLRTHGISLQHVSSAAKRTCSCLQEHGFRAYIVGGAVRDLMLGMTPKDFDVATDATPEEVRACFRRARIIGRRFQIVHVLFGAETIEVSTFRAGHDEHTQKDLHGRVLRDNVWGSMEEDASRRDFTVNALYYDPVAQTVLDYHGGTQDLKQRCLRVIGDPESRYREDPVRMLRAVRLAAKLGFNLDSLAHAPIARLATLMSNVPKARLFDEMLKLLLSGHAIESVQRLRAAGLQHGLLPLLDVILEQPLGARFVMLALKNTDQRIREGKRCSPGFLFATLLWHEVLANWQRRQSEGEKLISALFAAMDSVLEQQAEMLALTRRISADIKEIWLLQPRFERRTGRMPWRLVELPRFRAAWDFLLLRAESGEISQELADWWGAFAAADHATREALIATQAAALAQAKTPGTGASRRRRKHKPQNPV